jgi:hypothetical protein
VRSIRFGPLLDFLRRGAWPTIRRWAWPTLALLAAAAFFVPMLMRWSAYGKGDWGYFHFLDTVVRRTILDFGELPEWNPYHCGGNVLAGNTQAHVWSPWVVFPLLLGPAAGAKIAALGHAVVGAVGMLVLLGGLGIRGPGRFLGAVLFVCSGFFGHQVAGGHVWSWPFYYAPLVLHFYLRGCYDPKWASLAGVFWGLMVLEGGVYPAPYTGILLGCAALAMALGWTPLPDRPRARWHLPLVALGACAVVFLLVASLKLLPAVGHMAANPRRVPDYDRIGLGTLLDTLTWRNRGWGWDRPSHHDYPWWGEYGNYVGWAGLALAAGAVVARFRRARVPLVFLSLTLALSLGALGPGTPWDALHRLPVFENLRVPSRFAVLSSLVLAFLAALAVSEADAFLRERVRGKWLRRLLLPLPALAALGVAADVATFNAHQFVSEFIEKPPPLSAPPAPMKQVRGTYKRMYDHVALNHGTITCQEINSIPRSPRVREGEAEYGVSPPEAGSVRLVDWSPNEIRLAVRLDREARVWINQNHHEGWSSSVGWIEPIDNQLGVRLPAGTHRLRLTYRAPGLRTGAVLGALGLALVAAWFVVDHRLRRKRAAPAPPAAEEAKAAAPPEAPARFSRAWWLRRLRRVAPHAALAGLAVAVLGGSLLLAEPGDAVWTAQVHDYIRPRYRPGDAVQFNLGWVGDPLRRFKGLDQLAPNATAEVREGGYRRLWYVFCRRDGDERRRKDVLGRFAELERKDIGHYTVYLLEPENSARTAYLTDFLGEVRARVVERDGKARECERRDGRPACGPHAFQEVKLSREKLGGQHRRCVWMHPLPDQATLEVTFPGVLAGLDGPFVFRYGLTDAAATAKNGQPVNVTLRAGDRELRTVVARNEAGWFSSDVAVPAAASPDLVGAIATTDAGARHFCVNAVFERADPRDAAGEPAR